MTSAKKKLYYLIDRYGEAIVSSENSASKLKGIFCGTGELVPSLVPFRESKEEQIAMYVKDEDAARYGIPSLSLYADKSWLITASERIFTHDETLFVQLLLTRYIEPIPEPEPVPDPTYPISFSYGGNDFLLTVKKAIVKQGSLTVNIGAINKFVSNSVAGNEPITVEITALIPKSQAGSLAQTLKDAATAVPKTLSIDGSLEVYSVISDYSIGRSVSDSQSEVKITFTEIRSV
ncbi:MAG: hypothetical protein ACI4JX_06610 [Oscillospiraceae bacterium]